MNTHRSVRKTGKDHRCYECSQVIPKGSPAEYDSGLDEDEGYWYTVYRHPTCYAAAMHVCDITDRWFIEGWAGLREELPCWSFKMPLEVMIAKWPDVLDRIKANDG